MRDPLKVAAVICFSALAMLTAQAAPLPVDPPDSYQVRYAANLLAGDSYVNFTNDGASSTSAGVANGGFQNGNLCVNVYTYSPDEQLVSCCSCLVTPNALAVLSVRSDLVSNTLTPIQPTSVVVKLVGSLGGETRTTCDAATVTKAGVNPLAAGMKAWGTTIHALPVTAGTPAGTFGVGETEFSRGALSDAELTRMTQLCAFIKANGSGYGICKSCRFGGLGASSK